MAFAARIGPLTEELVQSLTPSSAQAAGKLRSRCDACLRKLRSHPYLRTNPFEVDDRLDGLDERFRVNGRDGLADALRERRAALPRAAAAPASCLPDILFLLLELSDQPTFKTRLRDLEPPAPPAEAATARAHPPLRWEQVAAEDGWDGDGDLWKSISYSSDDDDSDDSDRDRDSAVDSSDATSLSAQGDAAAVRLAEESIVHPEDDEALGAVLRAQQWRAQLPPPHAARPDGSEPRVTVSEVQLVREALFMLHGLEGTLFDAAAPPFRLAHVADETLRALTGALAEPARHLRLLRSFVARPQTVAHLQTLQDCIARHLRDLDRGLADVQARLASPRGEVVVSLTLVMGELAPRLEPLLALSHIVARVQEAAESDTFRYLELLFDETGVAQLAGKPGIYEFLARIFVDCFNVYLRPIRHWMHEGRLLPADELFFITEPSSGHVPLGDTWHSRFCLRRAADGGLHAPSFLQPAAGKIYNAGKNIVVLKLLGSHDAAAVLSPQLHDDPPLDYYALCPPGFELAPFADLFAAAFDRWVRSQYQRTSVTLKNALLRDWGLSASLDALRALYLMSDGHAAAAFCEALFAKLDATDAAWHGRHGLTAAGREAFASRLDPNRLSVDFDAAASRLTASECRCSVKKALPAVRVGYRVPWPVQMIVSAESVSRYQAVFTLLLQIKRASHALQKLKILDYYWTDHENWGERSLVYSARSKLLWFCSTIHAYLATLVLEPVESRMRRELEAAEDIDAMVAVHSGAMKQMIDQACLGSSLQPIREAILDMLDLAIKLGHSQSHAPSEPAHGQSSSSLATLKEIATDFDRHLRFVAEGLRSVARASSSSASAKWEILADMLQSDVGGGR
ncbi:hypothetical protein CDD83_6614 [Cordyceps sp. RAO-2017]|nr:hypothetical protein CDD83_6614 [Cordyceps sp. RAO-2017]